MKKLYLFKLLVLVLFTIFFASCANSPSTAEQAAAAAASCGAPVIDGAVKTLDSACRVSSEEEHLRLEGVSVSTGQTLTVWTSSNSDRSSAYRISFNGTSSEVSIENLAHAGTNRVVFTGATLSTTTTYCFDLHGEENPAHVMMWKGANCDVSPADNIASVEFESENCTGTCTLTSWDGSDTKPSDTGIYYQASATRVTVTKISTNTPRHSD